MHRSRRMFAAIRRIKGTLTHHKVVHPKQQHHSALVAYLATHLCQCRFSTDSSCKNSSKNHRYVTITFLTDVEGDGAYFDRFVNHSKVLGFRTREPQFGRYARNRRSIAKQGATEMMGLDWNLGEWAEDYFPYDKEVVFLEAGDEEETSMLVYGGDVWDKGGADLYVIRQLLSLHARYPNRVHFLMGNRDINKLRIADELGVWRNGSGDSRNCGSHVNGSALEPLPFHGGVYWLRGTNLPGDPLRVVENEKGGIASSESSIFSQNRAKRLKWMLENTMGSIDAFELRRLELERERTAITNASSAFPSRHSRRSDKGDPLHDDCETNSTSTMHVTDDEVAESYIRSCDPNHGLMSQYLTRAKLIVRFGPALFMHGALPFVPDENEVHFPTPWLNAGFNSFSVWIQELNRFASDQISSWKEYAHDFKINNQFQRKGVWASEGGYSNDTTGGRMFGKLLQYGMNTLPDRSKNPSVVYSSWMKDGMPLEELEHPCWYEFFRMQGLEVIANGHQPVGDMPWPIQISSSDGSLVKFWILPCDTSFSGDTSWANIKDKCCDERDNVGRGSGPNGRGDVAFW
eukprot:CCRYP_005065-RA/>CCRYP_005065-RA protein AED:0.02 eAED:0.02 QI:201/1/1/1/0.33/0.25/4/2706/573